MIAQNSGSTGTVTVTGAGSNWSNAGGDLVTGQAGHGTLIIKDGGTVDNAYGWIGAETTSTGTVTVSGTGSTWTSSDGLFIGEDRNGTLNIEDGGKVSSGGGHAAYIGHYAGTGTVTVSGVNTDGTASTWTHDGDVVVGQAGTGTLTIKNGGKVDNNYGYVGADAGATGTVEVAGPGSLWINSGLLYVGAYGEGKLTIKDGARVRVGGAVTIGDALSGRGTLALEGTAASRGVLETSGIIHGAGAAIVTIDGGIFRATQSNSAFFSGFGSQDIAIGINGAVIDANGHDIGIAPVFSGVGALIKDGAGTLTLTGENTHGGGTRIDGGTLQIGDGNSSGSITGAVLNNGVLAFNRSDNALVIDGAISGTGAVEQTGTGKTTLTGENTNTGGTTISAGTLQVGNGGPSGSLTGDVTNDAALVFNRTGSTTADGNICGSGSLAQIGGGTTILSGTNTYGGGTTITAGILQLGDGGTSGSRRSMLASSNRQHAVRLA